MHQKNDSDTNDNEDNCEREPLAEDFCMVIHGEITVAAVLNRTRGRKGGLRCHNLVAAEPWFDPGRF